MNASIDPLRILVVEDDEASARLLQLLLKQRFEADVVIAPDCASARSEYAGDPFDLVTLDFQLPDGNGLELLQEMTASSDHPPAIMVTGHGDEKTASESIRLGADGYVVKDHRMQTLLNGAIEKALEREQYKRSLQESERQYRELVELAHSIILKMDGQGNILFINKFGSEFFGFAPEELVGRNAVGTIVPEVESTGRGLAAMIRDIVTEPDAHRTNFNENMLRDGRRVWVLWGNRSIRDENGKLVGTLSIGNYVTELQRSSANLEHMASIYSLMITVVRRLWKADGPEKVFNEVCRAFVDSGLFKMAWIGLFDETGSDVSPVGSAGDADYLERIDLSAIKVGLVGAGAGETGARAPVPLVHNDIPRDARAEPWWEEAVRRGYLSSASIPLVSGEQPVGLLGLYTDAPGFFNHEVTGLLESLAQDISLAVATP